MIDYSNQPYQLQKTAMSSLIWMQYFNRELYGHGLITEDEHRRMKFKIDTQYGNIHHSPAVPNLYSRHSS